MSILADIRKLASDLRKDLDSKRPQIPAKVGTISMHQSKNSRFLPILIALVLFVACAGSGVASADSITRTFSFTGSGFGPTAPIDPVLGSFTVTFDPTLTNFGSLPSFTSNLNVAGPYNFIFRPSQNFGELGAGHCDIQGCSAGSGNDNVVVGIFGAATAHPFINVLFYSTTSTSVLEASTTTLTFTEPVPVPEPPTLLFLCTGLASLALFGRKARARRRTCGAYY
jgi:hypothetical protein